MKKYLFLLFITPLSIWAQNGSSEKNVNNMQQVNINTNPASKIIVTTGTNTSGYTTPQEVSNFVNANIVAPNYVAKSTLSDSLTAHRNKINYVNSRIDSQIVTVRKYSYDIAQPALDTTININLNSNITIFELSELDETKGWGTIHLNINLPFLSKNGERKLIVKIGGNGANLNIYYFTQDNSSIINWGQGSVINFQFVKTGNQIGVWYAY